VSWLDQSRWVPDLELELIEEVLKWAR
jgi:hypothetical protein